MMSKTLPPPLLFALFGGLIAALPSSCTPTLALRLIALAVTAAALMFGVTAACQLQRANTTLNPKTPQKTAALFTRGVFRFSRNPMYVSLAALLYAEVCWLNNLYGLAAVWLFQAWLTRFQILPEEKILTEKFGTDYHRYCRQVPRWLL